MTKKLLLIFCFFSYTASYAQVVKPTKEETVSFIKRTMTGANYSGSIVHEVQLDDNYLQWKTGDASLLMNVRYSRIKWEAVTSVIDTDSNDPDNCTRIKISFSSKINYKASLFDHGEPAESIEEDSGNMVITIPRTKKESILKAILRLSEIAKEENKDPFDK